jgi:hypothetical protein
MTYNGGINQLLWGYLHASTALKQFENYQIVVICCKETGFDDWLTRSWLNLSNI